MIEPEHRLALKNLIQVYFLDNKRACELLSSGIYERRQIEEGGVSVCSQRLLEKIYETPCRRAVMISDRFKEEVLLDCSR